ncbi:Protein of unknown function [Stigmatella aurantiaca]|uniref:DUF2914 domain-containing protein n=1 Tax=Stigmatella aurantiaca TaxID=41 RepID=A0A1H7H1L0_STIAU|nr:DUF2914 domain-containing protein [Stigmatella aurantiaca]SEK44296.1 Protein of unknown function [Stigmatella aurantiaca]
MSAALATATPPPSDETAGAPEASPVSAASPAPNVLSTAPARVPPAPTVPLGDAEDAIPTAKTPTLLERVQSFRARNEKWEMAAFFFVGFAYDVFTLGRIDDTLAMVQQFVYLGVLASLLVLEQRYPEGVEPPKALAKVWRWREDAIHFFYGSLLSSFTLFFFKSASGLVALSFLVVMFGLLVANELPRFRKLGPVVRMTLFSLCVSMYLAYTLPVLTGRLNVWIFLLALVLAGGVIYGLMWMLRRWTVLEAKALRHQVALPGFGMQVLLLGLYLLRVLPPVPLSVTYSGIYHEVKRVNGPEGVEFHLSHQRPWWKFWQKGDQSFQVREGDKVNYFVSVFAPAGFHDYSVYVQWYFDDPKKGWRSFFRKALNARGTGAEAGFRTYANLTNPTPGDWIAVLETEDGHEINRLSFSVEKDESTEPRQFEVFVHKHGSRAK